MNVITKITSLLLALALFQPSLWAQEKNFPFTYGEELNFEVSYGWFNLADAKMVIAKNPRKSRTRSISKSTFTGKPKGPPPFLEE